MVAGPHSIWTKLDNGYSLSLVACIKCLFLLLLLEIIAFVEHGPFAVGALLLLLFFVQAYGQYALKLNAQE